MINNKLTQFENSFIEFLNSYNIDFYKDGEIFKLKESSFTIILIDDDNKEYIINNKIDFYLHKDRWICKREIVISRILLSLGMCKSIFARSCKIISAYNHQELADRIDNFLNANHIYGSSKAKYRYALIYNDKIVAAASFSKPRRIVRKIETEVTFNSYEWIRYASAINTSVVGGMGKLLNYFIKEQIQRGIKEIEVMSYSDLEWGNGNSYIKLGFKEIEKRAPVTFYIDKESYTRFNYREFNLLDRNKEEFYTIKNLGSNKLILHPKA